MSALRSWAEGGRQTGVVASWSGPSRVGMGLGVWDLGGGRQDKDTAHIRSNSYSAPPMSFHPANHRDDQPALNLRQLSNPPDGARPRYCRYSDSVCHSLCLSSFLRPPSALLFCSAGGGIHFLYVSPSFSLSRCPAAADHHPVRSPRG